MKCKDIMTKDIKACTPDCTIKEAVLLMKQINSGVIPVVNEDNVLKGIVTDRDVVLYSVLNDKDPDTTFIGEFMTKSIITAEAEEELDDTIHKMSENQVRRVPIVDENNKLVGLISLGDIAVRSKEEHETFEALEHISEQPRLRWW